MKKIITILAIGLAACIGLTANAQLEVNIGASKTDLHKNALVLGVTYLKSFDSLFGEKTRFVRGKNSFLVITPQLNIQTGTADAFSSIVVNATGLFTTFKTTHVAGLITPDYDKTFHVFPFALGIETNNQFNNINGIFSVGWIPYYQSYGRVTPDWIKRTSFGIFLQAGYKFKVDSTGTSATGGAKDESLEAPDKTILRIHGNVGIDTKQLIKINGLNIGLVSTADLWYDILNNAWYNKIEARGRFYLNDVQYLDFIYTHGSGAPLFNAADQYGLGLTLTFK